jgi:hypothetical protein
MYIENYSNFSESKAHEDPFFREFLQQRYQDLSQDRIKRLSAYLPRVLETRVIEECHDKWRWGTPSRTSAPRNLIRFRNPISDPDMELWTQAESWAMLHFRHMGDSKIDWDFEYASQALNMQSSPGLPHSRGYLQTPCFAKKRDFFNYEEGKYARKVYFEYLSRIDDPNYIPNALYTGANKKELRKVKKILTDDYRTYCAAPVENSMAGNAITYEMNQKFYANWHSSASFVGGSTFNCCWDILFKRLSKHPNATEMDVTAWDSTLGETMITSLSRVMWNFVRVQDRTKENRVRWNNLFKEIWMSVIVCPNGDLFFKTQGNPSGSFLTIVTNTIIHFMLFCYAWLKLAPVELRNYTAFCQHVELTLCGDDSLMTCSDQVKSFFNMVNITQVWKELGIQAKVEATGEGRLIDRQFLSQKTIIWNGNFVPYPDYDKTVSSMLWHTKAHLHVRWSYLKACALRLSTFFHPELNSLFADYIRWLELHHKAALISKSQRTREDPFTFDEVFSVYKLDWQVLRMYLYPEGGEDQPAMSSKSDLKEVLRQIHAEQIGYEAESEEEAQCYAESCTTSREATGQGQSSGQNCPHAKPDGKSC